MFLTIDVFDRKNKQLIVAPLSRPTHQHETHVLLGHETHKGAHHENRNAIDEVEKIEWSTLLRPKLEG